MKASAKPNQSITCIFLDIGGVLLSNGWDHLARKRAAKLHQKRPFTRAQFRSFMFAQSKPYPEMIELFARLKTRYGLKIAVVSNEARGLNEYRIRKFKLDRFVDFFISSCFIHIRKPDADVFRLALDIAQAPPRAVVYIEDTPMFVQIAEGLGIPSILHTDYKSTRAKLASFGLQKDEKDIHETS
jgi:putative hydrolase of the HAD superfamily